MVCCGCCDDDGKCIVITIAPPVARQPEEGKEGCWEKRGERMEQVKITRRERQKEGGTQAGRDKRAEKIKGAKGGLKERVK